MKGKKFDQEKIRWDCVPWKMIEGIAKVMTYGANKYNENPDDPNWSKVEDGEHRYFGAMMRHFMADKKGEVFDPESGEEHIDHFMFNAIAYASFRKQRSDKDDN